MKNKHKALLIYGLSALAGVLTASLIAGLVCAQGWLYSIYWGALGGGLGVTVAWFAWHIALKDWAPEMWQIGIYVLFACLGWLGGIMSTTWGVASLCLAVMVTAILMAIGTRFCKIVAAVKTTSSLERTLRYRLVDDKLGGAENLDAPLISYGGNALTVEEAVRAGLPAEQIEAARAYIARLIEE